MSALCSKTNSAGDILPTSNCAGGGGGGYPNGLALVSQKVNWLPRNATLARRELEAWRQIYDHVLLCELRDPKVLSPRPCDSQSCGCVVA